MKLLFVSLGCDKNLVDSEEMLGLLTGNGFEIVDDETEAEAIVVNTCCFINDAKEESVNTILEMAEYKKTGSCKVLVVTGCMAQRYKNEIIEEVPEVDAVLGTTSYGDILKAIREAMEGKHFQEFKDIDYLPEKLGKSARYHTFFRLYEKRCQTVAGCVHPLDSHEYGGRYVLFSPVRKKYQKSTRRVCAPSRLPGTPSNF